MNINTQRKTIAATINTISDHDQLLELVDKIDSSFDMLEISKTDPEEGESPAEYLVRRTRLCPVKAATEALDGAIAIITQAGIELVEPEKMKKKSEGKKKTKQPKSEGKKQSQPTEINVSRLAKILDQAPNDDVLYEMMGGCMGFMNSMKIPKAKGRLTIELVLKRAATVGKQGLIKRMEKGCKRILKEIRIDQQIADGFNELRQRVQGLDDETMTTVMSELDEELTELGIDPPKAPTAARLITKLERQLREADAETVQSLVEVLHELLNQLGIAPLNPGKVVRLRSAS